MPEQLVDTSNIHIEPDLAFEEQPVQVLDQKQWITREKTINFYKVQWSINPKMKPHVSNKSISKLNTRSFLLLYKTIMYINN